MKMAARTAVMARAKFWYFMKKICKAKKTGGEILSVTEIREKKPEKIKNFGIWLRYDSRTGTHNMYKETRALKLTDAIGSMYCEMAGRHRAFAQSIQIIKTEEVPDDKCRRAHVLQMQAFDLKFPVGRKIPVRPVKYKSTFSANRIATFRK